MKNMLLSLLLFLSLNTNAQTQVDRITSKCKDQVLMHLKENTDISEIPNAVLSVYELNTTLSEIENNDGKYYVVGNYNAVLSISSEQLNGKIEQSITGTFTAVVKSMLDDYVVTEFIAK